MDLLYGAPFAFLILAANVLISVLAFRNARLLNQLLLTTRGIRAGEWHRLITSGFVHGSGMHLFVNMVTFYFFGPVLESLLGSTRMLIIYFGSLLAASAWAVAENWRNSAYAALGASGAVSGVLLSFSILSPTTMLYVFFAIPMPAFVFAGLYIALSIALAGREGNRIAHEAHLGGALAGVVLTILLVPGSGVRFVSAVRDMLGL